MITTLKLTPENARERRMKSNVKNPSDIPFTLFILPDGQRLGYGKHPLALSPKNRIGHVWGHCRKNIIEKLKLAIKSNDEKRQRFLVKCLNIVQDDLHYCNYINGFNEKIESKKITFDEFVAKYRDQIINIDTKDF